MHIRLLQIAKDKSLQDPKWEYVGTPAQIIKQNKIGLFTEQKTYMLDLTKTSQDNPTTLLGIFKFHNLPIKESHVYKWKDCFINTLSGPETKTLPPFVISMQDYLNDDLNYLYEKKIICLQSQKKKVFKTNEYKNEILENGKKVIIKENIMLREGISFLLRTSNSYLMKNTSDILGWLYFKYKDFKKDISYLEAIAKFSELAKKHNIWIINDDYYKSLK